MNKAQVLKELEALGTAQNRKVYARHGVRGRMLGVSYADLGKLKKKIKVDHELAVALWESGIHDARVLAAMVVEPERLTARQIDEWVKDLDNYALTDAFSGVAVRSAHGCKRMEKWIRSKGEWTAAAGWNVLAHGAREDSDLTDDDLERFLEQIEEGIHFAKNRVRYAMNNALISIGMRPALTKMSVAAAKRIGKVEVDHGETGCKTPDAAPYIEKAVAHQREMAKRRRARTKKKVTRKKAAKRQAK